MAHYESPLMGRKRVNLRWWLATVVMVLGVCLGIALGSWQMQRAAQKKQLHALQQAQAQAPVIHASAVQRELAQTAPNWEAWLHRRIELQGQWLKAHTVYLDNRQMQGRAGFYVLTPLRLPSGDVVMVQRGWIARDFQERQALQPVQTPAGQVQVQGHIAAAPGRLFALGQEEVLDMQAPHIRQNLDLQQFAQQTSLPLWPVIVVQTGGASEGLLRAWPEPNAGLAKHYGYAFQWFAMAAVLAAMLLWFQLIRPLRALRRHHAS